VLTVDPSSPISGGAVLGDRVRMAAHSANPSVFIRSLAARGHLGGVTRTTRKVIDLLAVGGMELVIIETVGTGQSEVEVAELTDVKLMVCAPGMGDEMQAIKAGVLEVADLLVINKADLPDADRTANFLRSMLMHRGEAENRIAMKVSTLRREGLAELADAICARFEGAGEPDPVALLAETPQGTLARDAAELVMAMIRETAEPAVLALAADMAGGAIRRRDAARKAIGLLARDCV
jgi:LAO/AO transport system kinase